MIKFAARLEMRHATVETAGAGDRAVLGEHSDQEALMIGVAHIDVDRRKIQRAELVVLDADMDVADREVAERKLLLGLVPLFVESRPVHQSTVAKAKQDLAPVDIDAGDFDRAAKEREKRRPHIERVDTRESALVRMEKLDAFCANGQMTPRE